MHRDVKLANIFLHDDNVVIGDFGFAKHCAHIAETRLGTLITMAPEMLTGNRNVYASKVDVCSIRVCFYQMLFGKMPFDVKSIEDLIEKIRTQSGNNLNFPKDVSISPACKDLLIKLLQYNPKNRIEWSEFFNHSLFRFYSKNIKNRLGDISQSMIVRQNEDKVMLEFRNNKKTSSIASRLMTQNRCRVWSRISESIMPVTAMKER